MTGAQGVMICVCVCLGHYAQIFSIHFSLMIISHDRVVDSRDKVDVDKLAALQWRTISLILDLTPCTEFSPYVHELLFHSASVIGWYFVQFF